ncbi:MAG: hypothetical protein HY344_04775 [Candidatus Levybacteria bacterium]|nr:hypothetical protein [Candidatus Levybacteria bacterium]
MKFSRTERFIVILIALVLSVTSIYSWFNHGTILYYWDTLLPLDIKFAVETFFYNWNPINFPGYSGNGWSWFPYSLSVGILLKLFGSLSLTQALLYFSFIFLSIVNFYLMSKYLLVTVVGQDIEKHATVYKIISFLFAIFYAFNLYTFYYSYFMFNPQIYIYSLLPLNILALFKLYPLDKKDESQNIPKRWLFTFFATLFFMSPGFTTYVFLEQYLLLLFFYLFFHWFLSRHSIFSSRSLKIVLFLLMVVFSQWWWFFPSLLGFKDLYDSQSSLGTTVYFDVGSIRSNLLNSLRLFGSPMMNNNPFSWDFLYTKSLLFPFPLFLFLFLIIYLTTRIKTLANKFIPMFLLSVFIVTLFIVKLGNPPLAQITKFAFENLPFFGAFRDAWHKAGLFYVFAFLTLSSIGFACLAKVLIEKKQRLLLRISFFVLLVTGLVVTGPFFLFAYDNIKKIDFTYQDKKYTLSAKTNIPPEYYELKSYLSDKCAGTTILVVPRSSMISSAVWPKYDMSYVGQDILTRFVSCNFLSTQLLNNGPDSFNFSPYMLLEKGDFGGFKNFLLQNQIGLVLIRKDNIPYYYTNYIYLSNATPQMAIGFLNKDHDFKKTFENDFFELYSVESQDNNYNYGFSIPTSVVYTNSSLNSGRDYVSLSKQLGDKEDYLVINRNEDFKKYSSFVNLYAPVANCVGCVKIFSSVIKPPDESLLRKLKDLVKQLIGKNLTDDLSLDQKISYAIIDSTKEFSKMMEALEEKDALKSKNYISSYIKKMENIDSLFKKYKANFFDLSNKSTEIKNFLGAQNQKLSDYLNFGTVIRNDQIRGQLSLLLSLQNSKLSELDKTIWETDYKNKIYRMRLDIPKKDQYLCTADNYNNGLKIESITLGNLKKDNNSTISALLSKGNYPVSVEYSTNSILNIPSLRQKSGEVKEIDLGNIPNGLYKITFSPGLVSKQKIAVAVTKNKLDFKTLEFIGSSDIPQNDFIFIDTGSFISDKSYEKDFSISSLDKKKYYLYLFSLNPQSDQEDELEYKDLFVERIVEGGDIQLFCTTESSNIISTANINVVKESPVKYKITVPKGSNLGKFLVFNQSYGSDWEAFEYINGKKIVFPHFKNGYANAWFIDKHESTEINVVFSRQSLIVKNLFVTIILFAIALFFFLRYRNR